MPLTAASETVRSTLLRVSLAESTADLRAYGDVENTRVRARGRVLRGKALKKDIVATNFSVFDEWSNDSFWICFKSKVEY